MSLASSRSARSYEKVLTKAAVPLAHRALGNLQQWLIGTYHGVSKAQLQVYLDEFVFRHNRRTEPATNQPGMSKFEDLETSTTTDWGLLINKLAKEN